jgi:hypothetical protein
MDYSSDDEHRVPELVRDRSFGWRELEDFFEALDGALESAVSVEFGLFDLLDELVDEATLTKNVGPRSMMAVFACCWMNVAASAEPANLRSFTVPRDFFEDMLLRRPDGVNLIRRMEHGLRLLNDLKIEDWDWSPTVEFDLPRDE